MSAEETQSIQTPDCQPARCVSVHVCACVCVVEVAGCGGGGGAGEGRGGRVIPFQSVVKLAEGGRG